MTVVAMNLLMVTVTVTINLVVTVFQVFFEELHSYKLTWCFVIGLEHPASQGPAIVLAITIFIPLGDETEGLKPEALYPQ